MKETVRVCWEGNMAFTAEIGEYKIALDADPEHGGEHKGPKPKPLLMVALGGCTAMDVVSILKKMRAEPDDLEIELEGDIAEDHPKKFLAVVIRYKFTGKELPLEKLQKAIQLSEERYCGVNATLRPAVQLSTEIWINNRKVI